MTAPRRITLFDPTRQSTRRAAGNVKRQANVPVCTAVGVDVVVVVDEGAGVNETGR